MSDTSTLDQFDLIIVSPDSLIFDGKAKKLLAPGFNQEIAILPNHTPLYAQLNKGELVVTTNMNQVKTFPIDGGIIRVKVNRVSIIVGFEVLRQ